jgi:uncharacterized protein YaiL (DUF2058 family)
MSESLRDQLLKSGLVSKIKSEARPQPAQRPHSAKPQKPQRPAPQGPRPPRRDQGEIDLAKAYALRDRNEREQREREQRAAEQRAREKKERKQKLAALLGSGVALNDASADIPRHFPHANKIRRIYVTAEQLPRLNGGELAVVQYGGRYLLVTRDTAVAAQAIDAEALVLLCDPHAVDEDGIPADLVW